MGLREWAFGCRGFFRFRAWAFFFGRRLSGGRLTWSIGDLSQQGHKYLNRGWKYV